MNDAERRSAIREFFTVPCPFLHPRTLAVGGCLTFLGIVVAASGDLGVGGLLAAAGATYTGLLPLRARAKPGDRANEALLVSVLRYPEAKERYVRRPSPEQVTDWLLEDLAKIREDSKPRLGLDDTTRDAHCVVGPLYGSEVDGFDEDLVLRRRVPDGYLYSSYRVSVFQFAETHLGVYQCHFNLLRNQVAAERTAEIFYKDVVAVQITTESPNQVLKSGERLERATTFSLTVASGDRIRIVLDDPAIRTGERIRALGDFAAENIRAMLRQYKTPPREI
jgi:hypothetical protein